LSKLVVIEFEVSTELKVGVLISIVDICFDDKSGEDTDSEELGIMFVSLVPISITNVVPVLVNDWLVVMSELSDEIDFVVEP
jgi:hypothetical protein